jgi:regulator of protease activity HflC (stomatin/prohibitin superfamily)
MLFLKYVLFAVGVGLFGGAAGVVGYDLYIALQLRRFFGGLSESEAALSVAKPRELRWKLASKLGAIACMVVLVGMSIVVVPDGYGGVRLSQISGVQPGALSEGTHLIVPLVQQVICYDLRDRVYSTASVQNAKNKSEVLRVQGREGLSIGLAIAVRYRLDVKRLDSIHANLAQPVEEEVVAPVVDTIFRQIAPNYLVREVFATRREELRQRAAEAITARLGADGIVVKEVLLRDVQLPAEYAKGLEGLLLKEQENDRMGTETEIKQKSVRIAELEADADKVRAVKQAEAQAQVRVLQARAESDAMQYTLPLKQKQVEQTRLESEARKQATVQNAEAMAQAKIIDSKAELQRRDMLAGAEANRIRLTAAADSERLKLEAAVLKQNPMLIQKIIAERLSDKLQIIMVPTDGKNFFASDVLKSAFAGRPQAEEPDSDAAPTPKLGANRNDPPPAPRKPEERPRQ